MSHLVFEYQVVLRLEFNQVHQNTLHILRKGNSTLARPTLMPVPFFADLVMVILKYVRCIKIFATF
jgi:hypothetical protein